MKWKMSWWVVLPEYSTSQPMQTGTLPQQESPSRSHPPTMRRGNMRILYMVSFLTERACLSNRGRRRQELCTRLQGSCPNLLSQMERRLWTSNWQRNIAPRWSPRMRQHPRSQWLHRGDSMWRRPTRRVFEVRRMTEVRGSEYNCKYSCTY